MQFFALDVSEAGDSARPDPEGPEDSWEGDEDAIVVLALETPEAWRGLQRDYERPRKSDAPESEGRFLPWRRCLSIAMASGAVSAVVEKRFIDRDFRSENSALYSRALASTPDSSHKVHFFTRQVSEENIRVAHQTGIADFADAYVGYVVVRPAPLAIVGRAMLRPPPWVTARTAVCERTSFFGLDLAVVGVPFMEQDRRLAVCAHVAIWVIHATHSIRAGTRNLPIARIVSTANPDMKAGASGLTGPEVCNALRSIGFRPQYFNAGWNLPPCLPPAWAGKSRIEKAVLALGIESDEESRGGSVESDDEFEMRVAAHLLPSLNSGMPVYVANGGHAFVVCGYQKSSAGEIEYLVHDDQVGPYLRVASPAGDSRVARAAQVPPDLGDAFLAFRSGEAGAAFEMQRPLADDAAELLSAQLIGLKDLKVKRWREFIVPLRDNVHLRLHAAEEFAMWKLQNVISSLEDAGRSFEVAPGVSLSNLVAPHDLLEVRTYVVEAARFRSSLSQRGVPGPIIEAYRMARLPLNVHVVEFLLKERPSSSDRVVAELIMDSTSGEDKPWIHFLRIGRYLRRYKSSGIVDNADVGASRPWKTGSPGSRFALARLPNSLGAVPFGEWIPG